MDQYLVCYFIQFQITPYVILYDKQSLCDTYSHSRILCFNFLSLCIDFSQCCRQPFGRSKSSATSVLIRC
jgi:hypothetical protein